MASADSRQSGSAMWNVGTFSAQMRAKIAGIAAVIAADDDHQVDRLVLQQRDDRVLPVLGGAADGVERAEPRRELLGAVAVGHRPDETAPAPRATPTSASWSGSPGRCARGRGRDRNPATRASRKRARNAVAIAAAADVVADRVGLVEVQHDEEAAVREGRAPAMRSPASPRATPCRE